MKAIRDVFCALWMLAVLVSCDDPQKKDSDVRPLDTEGNPVGNSDDGGILLLQKEIQNQMEIVGYFDKRNLAEKKIILIELIGQIAPSVDHSLSITQFRVLADELREITPKAFKKATEKDNGNVDLMVLLDFVFDN